MLWSGWLVFPCEPRDSDLRPRGEGRPVGLHLSDVIQKMRIAAGEALEDVPGDQPYVRMQEGWLWESAQEYVQAGMSLSEAMDAAFKRYMSAVRRDVARQVALLKDDIHMTPDALNPELGEIESYKCTRKTLRTAREQVDFEQNYWHWLVQEKAYCYAAGVDTVRWVVLWQAGDYSKGVGSSPQMLQSVGVFTAEELVENWRVVLRHAAKLREGDNGIH